MKLHDYQRPPSDVDWLIWILRGGRGSGKTLAGAEWIWEQAKHYPYVGIAAATFGDGRDFCIEGESGIKVLHPELDFNRSIGEMTFPSGAHGKLYSGEKPERARGPNLYALWCDEFCSWKYQQATWDMLMFTLRKGASRTCITTTPKPSKLWKELQTRPTSRIVVASTYQNIANLSRSFIENIVKPYEGTRLGRQELNAEDVEDYEGALWNHDQLEALRVASHPPFVRVAVAIDPATTDKPTSNEAGIIAAGLGTDDQAYVIDDSSLQGDPEKWAYAGVACYHRHGANELLAEDNQGGLMVSITIGTIPNAPPVRLIHAIHSKRARAEPVSMLYEQKRVHHVGFFPTLEDEMCSWDAKSKESPNRIDALTHCLTALMLEGGESYGESSIAQPYQFADSPY